MQYSVVMDRKTEEKNLGGMMDSELVDRFTEQAQQRGFKTKRALAGAVKLWVQLPEEMQSRIASEETSEDAFSDLVRSIVQEQLEAFRRTLSPEQRAIVDKNLQETRDKIHRKK